MKRIFWRLAKGANTSPVYETGYFDVMKEIENSPNLYLTGMFMSYPERSMEESLKLGCKVAEEVLRTKES